MCPVTVPYMAWGVHRLPSTVPCFSATESGFCQLQAYKGCSLVRATQHGVSATRMYEDVFKGPPQRQLEPASVVNSVLPPPVVHSLDS